MLMKIMDSENLGPSQLLLVCITDAVESDQHLLLENPQDRFFEDFSYPSPASRSLLGIQRLYVAKQGTIRQFQAP
jgi:hypothetical protein